MAAPRRHPVQRGRARVGVSVVPGGLRPPLVRQNKQDVGPVGRTAQKAWRTQPLERCGSKKLPPARRVQSHNRLDPSVLYFFGFFTGSGPIRSMVTPTRFTVTTTLSARTGPGL